MSKNNFVKLTNDELGINIPFSIGIHATYKLIEYKTEHFRNYWRLQIQLVKDIVVTSGIKQQIKSKIKDIHFIPKYNNLRYHYVATELSSSKIDSKLKEYLKNVQGKKMKYSKFKSDLLALNNDDPLKSLNFPNIDIKLNTGNNFNKK